jgi:hypothetical protein
MSDDLEVLVARLRVGFTYDDRTDAADFIEAQEAEITRLRAALASARREGMEQAAQIATEFEIVAHLHGPWSDVPDECAVQASREIAAAIRAAAGDGKP